MPTTIWTELIISGLQATWDDGMTLWDAVGSTWDPAGGIVWTEIS